MATCPLTLPVAHCGNWTTGELFLLHSALVPEPQGGHSWSIAHSSCRVWLGNPWHQWPLHGMSGSLLFLLPQWKSLLEAGWSHLAPVQHAPCANSLYSCTRACPFCLRSHGKLREDTGHLNMNVQFLLGKKTRKVFKNGE